MLPQLISWLTAATAVAPQVHHGLQVTTPAWEHECEEGFEALMARLVRSSTDPCQFFPHSLLLAGQYKQLATGLDLLIPKDPLSAVSSSSWDPTPVLKKCVVRVGSSPPPTEQQCKVCPSTDRSTMLKSMSMYWHWHDSYVLITGLYTHIYRCCTLI